MKPKSQRLLLVVLAVAALIAAALVVLSLWLVYKARRAIARLMDRLNPPPAMKNVTPPPEA